MIELKDVRDFLKTSGIAEHYYIGKLNNKEDKSVGVYQYKRYNEYERAIGSVDADTIKQKRVSVLVHWNKNAAETETAANALFKFLEHLNDIHETPIIGGHKVCYFGFLQNEPLDVGTDEFKTYERVIEFTIYYQK